MNNSIDIISICDDTEVLAVRSVLEYWGIKVNIHFIAKAQDIVDVFGGDMANNILIMCHGVNDGICLPELAPEIEIAQPFCKVLTPADLDTFLELNAQTVVCTGCKTGSPSFVNTFLSKGAKCYIAPNDFPEGSASLLFVINLYYHLLVNEVTVDEAYARASIIDGETEMFEIFRQTAANSR